MTHCEHMVTFPRGHALSELKNVESRLKSLGVTYDEIRNLKIEARQKKQNMVSYLTEFCERLKR